MNITLAKTEQNTKKMKKADMKVLATRIIVAVLAAVMILGSVITMIPGLF